MRDLESKFYIYLKAVLFLMIGIVSGGLLLFQNFNSRNLLLLGLTIWGFSRAYYFAFYVIQNYIDSSFRYSGLFAFVRHILGRRP